MVHFHNFTNDEILCTFKSNIHVLFSPGSSHLVDIPIEGTISLSPVHSFKEPYFESKTEFDIKLPISPRATLSSRKLPVVCRWRIYTQNQLSEILVFPKRDLGSFLSEIPDTVSLYSLLLPGTHDTMSFYGWPISQCQSLQTPLQIQLENGIRVIDIRLSNINGKLTAYHGTYPQKTPFQKILTTVHSFLTSPTSCRETIVMSIKQEDHTNTPPAVFSRLVREEIEESPLQFFLENRIPQLGEVRGKVVLLSRFGGNGNEWENGLEGIGIHPTNWPDSEKEGFVWECKDVVVRTHDWYAIPSFLYIPEKLSLATQFLLPPPNNDNNHPTLSIIYTSAASFPFAAPKPIAEGFGWPKWGLGVEGMNPRLGKWILDRIKSSCRLRGWVLVDFYNQPEDSLVELLVECNFTERRSGEEGW
ncbi:PLC-like phosphodiesterase [Lentinula aciculospora]|uniref:PLC-like phosphodiesterase n=1 Tax=Lentinula aciculospora TaxID=153920 RepID=A0A9W9DGN2_9AGAR|nr:PLC-like phosphodiesterase [Lentinula aciculospora]